MTKRRLSKDGGHELGFPEHEGYSSVGEEVKTSLSDEESGEEIVEEEQDLDFDNDGGIESGTINSGIQDQDNMYKHAVADTTISMLGRSSIFDYDRRSNRREH